VVFPKIPAGKPSRAEGVGGCKRGKKKTRGGGGWCAVKKKVKASMVATGEKRGALLAKSKAQKQGNEPWLSDTPRGREQ